TGHESLALVLDGREHALTEHDGRIRLPIIAVRVLETSTKNPGVHAQRRGLRHGKGDSGARRVTDRLARHRCVNVDYLEGSGGADGIGDPGVERRAVEPARESWGYARENRGMAAPVNQVWTSVPNRAEP